MKNEIKCPACGTYFTLDENQYDKLIRSVKDEIFQKELNERIQAIKQNEKLQYQLSLNSLNEQITSLKNALQNKDKDNLLVINEKTKKKDEEISKLNEILNSLKLDNKDKINNKDLEINKLKLDIETLKNDISKEKDMLETAHKHTLKEKDEQIEFYKNLKTKQNNKIIGESLEIHCATEFEKIRTFLPNATFEKDNDISSGTKGDFIFKESSDGIEFISIMFEMKNEFDDSTKKHKNIDFLEKLDKDRTDKKCQYAVLVTLLEPESDLYNSGIVDMSYKYHDMYIIRPQFFIPLITMLRNVCLRNIATLKQLVEAKQASIDVENFETELNKYREGFNKNYNLAKSKYENAIKEIDKTISVLLQVKTDLLGSENNLRLADEKLQSITIRKLTNQSPSLKEAFKKLKQK